MARQTCNHCRKRKSISDFYTDFRFNDRRRVTICKSCMKDRAKERRYNFTLPRKRNSYKETAVRRGISFELTKDDFSTFWKAPCTYCGAEIETIGLDRLDNELGYICGNVVACCMTCNSMKGRLSFKEFVAQCSRIVIRANAAIARRE